MYSNFTGLNTTKVTFILTIFYFSLFYFHTQNTKHTHTHTPRARSETYFGQYVLGHRPANKSRLVKIDAALQHANGLGVLLAIDRNARSTSWHDSTTNARGRTVDEYLMSIQLYMLKEESLNTTFRN